MGDDGSLMTVLEMLRKPRPESPADESARPPVHPLVRPLVGGAATAAATLGIVLAVVGIAASLAHRADLHWGEIFGVGSALWLLTGGARLHVDQVIVAFTPLLGFALLLGGAVLGARRSLRGEGPRRDPYLAWLGGYAAVALLAIALTFAGPIRTVWWTVPVPLVGVPGLALALVEVRRGRLDDLVHRLPRWVRRCVRPIVQTSVLALVTGVLLVLISALGHWRDITAVTRTLTPGLTGGTALLLAQLLISPNLGLWALGFVAGPGFSIAEGTGVSLGGSSLGVLPQVPVLAAIPGPGHFGWWSRLLLLIPILFGAYAARRTLAEIPRLARGRVKFTAVAVTVVGSSVTLAAVDLLGGGSAGMERIRDIGVSAPALAFFMALLMGVGAAIVTLRDWLRLRR